jgi:transposase
MFSRENLAALDESGYRYIVAAKLKTLKGDVKEKILAEESYKPTVLGKHLAWVSDIEYEGKRLITSYKSSRAMNDAKNRREVLDKIEKTIGQRGSTKKLISNSGVKKYTTTANSITQIDQDKIAADAMWDGLHGVITNDKNMDAAAVIARYAGLWVIEDSFRINKHNLQMRPIFHYTPKRIEAHIAICYMGFAIIKYLQYKVALTQKISPREIMRSLLGVQASILQHKITGDLYRMPGVFKQEARKIYKTFGVARSSGAEVYYN